MRLIRFLGGLLGKHERILYTAQTPRRILVQLIYTSIIGYETTSVSIHMPHFEGLAYETNSIEWL